MLAITASLRETLDERESEALRKILPREVWTKVGRGPCSMLGGT